MEVSEQIERFKEFIESEYEINLHEMIRTGKKSIILSFNKLSKFDVELAEMLLQDPEEIIRAAEMSLEHFDLPTEKNKLNIRFIDLPDTQRIRIGDIRSEHLGKFLVIQGIVRQTSDIRPQVTNAKFECPACGNTMTILQIDSKFKEPTRCSCGRRGKFRLLSKELVDAQRLVIEEPPESLEGGEQPKRLSVFLKDDLVEPKMEKKTTPGSKVDIIGVVKEIPNFLKSGIQSVRYDLAVETNYIVSVQEDYSNVELNVDDIKKIKEFAKDKNVFNKFVSSIAPSIYGHEKIKEALVLQMFSGYRKIRADGTVSRGDIHVLLVGDPGSGKCLVGNTKIVLADGSILTISDFVNSNSIKKIDGGFEGNNFTVPSINLDGRIAFNNSNIVWKRKNNDSLIKITTSSGNKLITTKNHPLFTTINGIICSIPAEALSVGSYIATPRFINVNTTIQKLNFNFKKSISKNRIVLSVPEYLDKGIARFFGYLIGEGWVRLRDKSGMITFTNNDLNLINDFISQLKRFRVNYAIRLSHKGKSSTEVYSCSIELVRFIQSVEKSLIMKSKDKVIPQIIKKSPNYILREFIKAYFDSEAYVDVNKRVIEVSSASKDLIEELKILLLRFGILSRICKKYKYASNTSLRIIRPYYFLLIYGKDVEKYSNLIGFNSINKKSRLKNVIDNKSYYNTNVDVLPNIHNLLKELRENYKLKQSSFLIPRASYQHYERGDRLPSREQLSKILKSYPISDFRVDILHKFASADIFWDKVIKLEEVSLYDKYVYDIQVNDTHNYIANSIIVHNSQILQFISKAAPKARFISGKGSSSAGLTASVIKDEFLKGYSLEAGAMVLANKGIACLHPSTQVIVNNKIYSIEGLYKKEIEKEYHSNTERVFVNDINYNIPSLDKDNLSVFSTNSTKIRRKLYEGNLLNIKFNSGFNLLLTPDHKLINGSSLEWNESSMFKKGNYVLAPLKLNLNTNDILFLDILPDNWKVGLKKEEKEELKRHILKKFSNLSEFNKRFDVDKNYLSGGKQFKIFKFREILKYLGIYDSWKYRRFTFIRNKKGERLLTYKLTPELSYIFGFVFGDGNFSSSKRRSRFNISQSKVNSKFIDQLNKYAVFVFGKEFGKYGRTSKSIIRGKEVISYNYTLYHNSNLLCELIKDIIGNKFENILTLPDECLKSFIAGLFDSDGCSSIKNSLKSSKNYRIQHINILLSNCRQLNLNLMLALRRFDVYSKLNKGKNILNLEITGRIDVHQLINSIKEYSIKAQNSKLIPRLINISSTSDKLPQEVIAKISRNISKLNKSILLKKGIWSYVYNYANFKIQPSRDQLNKFVGRVGNFISEDDKNLINNLLRRDIFIDKIIDINEVPYSGYVYDLYVPLTNNFIADGIVVHNCIDELDKMGPDDRSALHQALEQQTITISKANIQATLMAQTTLLAAANPKLGRFDPYTSIAAQIDLPSTLINRFDLIFPIRDIPNKELDEKIAQHVLELPLKPELLKTEITVEFLRKYIAYAKQNIFPKLSDAAIDEIRNFYVGLRNSSSGGEERIRPIPISARQLEALVRLAEASARIKLSDSVTRLDAKRSIALLKHCLMQVGFDPETGKIDIDRISTGITASVRNKIIVIKEIIDELSSDGIKSIPIEQIINLAAEKGIEESSVEDVIDKLRKNGDIFEPKHGYVSRI